MQFPAEAHDTPPTRPFGVALAFAGSGRSTPVAHVPDVSVNNTP